MSRHSYSRIWVYLTWGTLERRPFLRGPAAARVSAFLRDYAQEKKIYMAINYVNSDHAHALIDLPARTSLEDAVQLLKGASSHWINENNVTPGKFGWGRGYGAFSVSHSGFEQVARYIAGQEEHHRKQNFSDELRAPVQRYGLVWHEETVETVPSSGRASYTRLKPGVNEKGTGGTKPAVSQITSTANTPVIGKVRTNLAVPSVKGTNTARTVGKVLNDMEKVS